MPVRKISDQALMLLSGGRRKHLFFITTTTFFLFFVTLFSLNHRQDIHEILPLCGVYGQQSRCRQKTAHEAAKNSTLGFGAIILINLPERSDRRDAFALAASVSGLETTYVESAVHGQEVAEKARPHGKAHNMDNAHMGSWRSHMNAVRWILDNNYETALMLEDDADWDLDIKENMQALSQGFQNNPLITSRPEDADRFPYGNDWDILHLSASRIETAPHPLDSICHIYPDPVLPAEPPDKPPCHKKGWGCYADLLNHLGVPQEGHRAVIPSYLSLGLSAIALTRAGAQRLLYLLEWKDLDTGLDYSLRDHLMAGDLKGWTTVPPVFGHWSRNGKTDSDIKGGGHSNETGSNDGGYSSLLRMPGVRAHLDDLLDRDNVWERLNEGQASLEG